MNSGRICKFPFLQQHSVEKWKIWSHWKNISSNQLFSDLFSNPLLSRNFLKKGHSVVKTKIYSHTIHAEISWNQHARFSLKKLLNSWLDETFFDESNFFILPHYLWRRLLFLDTMPCFHRFHEVLAEQENIISNAFLVFTFHASFWWIIESTVRKSAIKRDQDFYGKINIFSVRSTFLLKKLLIQSWFHEFFKQCAVWKNEKFSLTEHFFVKSTV